MIAPRPNDTAPSKVALTSPIIRSNHTTSRATEAAAPATRSPVSISSVNSGFYSASRLQSGARESATAPNRYLSRQLLKILGCIQSRHDGGITPSTTDCRTDRGETAPGDQPPLIAPILARSIAPIDRQAVRAVGATQAQRSVGNLLHRPHISQDVIGRH